MLAIGTRLLGTSDAYEVLAEHGHGGFGVTYRGRRRRDGLDVIVKALRLRGLPDWKTFDLFEREAAVLRSLSHPSIPAWVDHFPLHEVGRQAGFVLVQEFIPGKTLQQTLREAGGLQAGEMQHWFADLLAVVAYLHERTPPVIHRDITPKNIILRPSGPAALVDFGSVQAAFAAGDTVASTSVGTFGYAPMEQLLGRATSASDLYGLGMTFLAAATGCEPSGMPLDGVQVDVGRLLGTGHPLTRLLQEMTEPDPRNRLHDASVALRRLRDSAFQSTVAARPVADEAGHADRCDDYLTELANRLTQAGFTIVRGGNVDRTPLVFSATRPAGHLRERRSVHIYVAAAAQLEGHRDLNRPVGHFPMTLFAVSAARLPEHRGFFGQLAGGGFLAVAVVVAPLGAEHLAAARVAAGIRQPDGGALVPVVINTDANVAEILVEPSALGDGGADLVSLVHALCGPAARRDAETA